MVKAIQDPNLGKHEYPRHPCDTGEVWVASLIHKPDGNSSNVNEPCGHKLLAEGMQSNTLGGALERLLFTTAKALAGHERGVGAEDVVQGYDED
jgi:hypothetical protein